MAAPCERHTVLHQLDNCVAAILTAPTEACVHLCNDAWQFDRPSSLMLTELHRRVTLTSFD